MTIGERLITQKETRNQIIREKEMAHLESGGSVEEEREAYNTE